MYAGAISNSTNTAQLIDSNLAAVYPASLFQSFAINLDSRSTATPIQRKRVNFPFEKFIKFIHHIAMVTVVSADNVYLCMHRQTYAYLATKLSYCAFQLSYSMDDMFY